MQSRADRIESLLRTRFAPSRIEVRDDSARHEGHAGSRPEGETHYSVLLVSAAFSGQSRVERARAVHTALAEEFGSGMHALSLTLVAPGEQRTNACGSQFAEKPGQGRSP
ncbi:MAG: BolA family protein [Acetobacteraceae bacterium]